MTNKEPSLNWNDVVQSLDFPGFKVNDAAALRIIVNTVKYGLHFRDKVPIESVHFPVEKLLQRWNNSEGQFSVFKMALHNPEVIPFGDMEGSHRVYINVLRTPPDESDRHVATWTSIDLMEALLNLGDDPSLREGVKELILIGVKHCPDVIVLALAQAATQWTSLRKELLDKLIVRYVAPGVNSSSIILYIWNNCGQIPQLRDLLRAALKKYYKEEPADQTRLNRIYEIAKELKALENLIQIGSEDDFYFAIDLACLASRQNFLNLTKWLEKYHNDALFVQELHKWLSKMLQQNRNLAEQPKELVTIREFLDSCVGKGPNAVGASVAPPGVPDLLGQAMRPGMISPSIYDIASPLSKPGGVLSGKGPGITPSPPTFQPTSLGGALEGLGGINPGGYGAASHPDFSNSAVRDLFIRSTPGSHNAGVR